MAFISACCRKWIEGLCCVCLLLSAPAWAAGLTVIEGALAQRDQSLLISADLRIDLPEELDTALIRGITLPFTFEFELLHPRWYWFDERRVIAKREAELRYSGLTRQYTLAQENARQHFDSREAAMFALSKIRDWPVGEIGQLRDSEAFHARLRCRLDTERLPKPFQVNALSNPNWALASEWHEWVYRPQNPHDAAPVEQAQPVPSTGQRP